MIYAIASLCDWFGAKRVAIRLFAAAPRSDYGAWWGAVGLMQTGKDEETLRLLTRARAVHPEWKRTKRLLATLYLRRDPEKAVQLYSCLLYTSDAADDLLCVDLGGRRII